MTYLHWNDISNTDLFNLMRVTKITRKFYMKVKIFLFVRIFVSLIIPHLENYRPSLESKCNWRHREIRINTKTTLPDITKGQTHKRRFDRNV